MALPAQAPSSAAAREGRRADRSRSIGEQVTAVQRRRLLVAMAELTREQGASSVTVAQVVERVRVSRRTFYEVFDDREDCLIAALQDAVNRAAAAMAAAYDPAAPWRRRVRGALEAFLGFVDDNPAAGRLLVVDSLGCGPRALGLRASVLARVTGLVAQGGEDLGTVDAQLAAEATVGGALSILHSRLLEPGSGPVIGLAGALMGTIVLPYLGAAAARRELEMPVAAPAPAGRLGGDPLQSLGMRLTYRTVLMLRAIAAHPGGSNRVVGLAAGIDDQGQISKLLRRLAGFGLIENVGAGAGRGAPNEWRLTERGEEVGRLLVAER